MKHWLSTVLLALLSMTLGGCEMEFSDNGKLDGMWQLTAFDGPEASALDCRNTGIYWAFQGDITLLHHPDYPEVVGSFDHKGGVLTLGPLYINNREEGNPDVDDLKQLSPFMIFSYPCVFTVEKLDGKEMLLFYEGRRLCFRKY